MMVPWSLFLLSKSSILGLTAVVNVFLMLSCTINILFALRFIEGTYLWVVLGTYLLLYDICLVCDIFCREWLHSFLSQVAKLKTNAVTANSFHWVLPTLCSLSSAFALCIYLLIEELEFFVSTFSQSFALGYFFYLCFGFVIRTLMP